MNLSDLRSHVRSLTAIASTDIISNADLDIFINEAYFEICREADWPFLRAETTLNVATGVDTYTLPVGVQETRIASIASLATNDSNRRQLRPRSRYTTDDSPGPVINGRPLEYSCWTGSIKLFPVPDDAEALTIRYLTNPTKLTTGTDVPVFDEKFHSLIAYGAAVRVLVREGDDTERRAYYLTQFRSGMEQMKTDYLSERDQSILRLGGRRRVFPRRRNTFGV